MSQHRAMLRCFLVNWLLVQSLPSISIPFFTTLATVCYGIVGSSLMKEHNLHISHSTRIFINYLSMEDPDWETVTPKQNSPASPSQSTSSIWPFEVVPSARIKHFQKIDTQVYIQNPTLEPSERIFTMASFHAYKFDKRVKCVDDQNSQDQV